MPQSVLTIKRYDFIIAFFVGITNLKYSMFRPTFIMFVGQFWQILCSNLVKVMLIIFWIRNNMYVLWGNLPRTQILYNH